MGTGEAMFVDPDDDNDGVPDTATMLAGCEPRSGRQPLSTAKQRLRRRRRNDQVPDTGRQLLAGAEPRQGRHR